jgi:regulator of replication initiation timing
MTARSIFENCRLQMEDEHLHRVLNPEGRVGPFRVARNQGEEGLREVEVKQSAQILYAAPGHLVCRERVSWWLWGSWLR